LVKEAEEKRRFGSISLPRSLVKEVEKVVDQLGYWPAKTHFVHEAVMEKLERYKKELEDRCAREGAVT